MRKTSPCLEAVPNSKLKRPRPTGAEEASGSDQALIEIRLRYVVRESEIVQAIRAANIGDVEEVEHLADQFDVVPLGEGKCPAHPSVPRVKPVPEVQSRSNRVQHSANAAGECDAWSRSGAGTQGVPGGNRRVQFRAVLNLPGQRISRNAQE